MKARLSQVSALLSSPVTSAFSPQPRREHVAIASRWGSAQSPFKTIERPLQKWPRRFWITFHIDVLVGKQEYNAGPRARSTHTFIHTAMTAHVRVE